MWFEVSEGLPYHWDVCRDCRWEWMTKNESERSRDGGSSSSRKAQGFNHRSHHPVVYFSFISIIFFKLKKNSPLPAPPKSPLYFSHEPSLTRWRLNKHTNRKKHTNGNTILKHSNYFNSLCVLLGDFITKFFKIIEKKAEEKRIVSIYWLHIFNH